MNMMNRNKTIGEIIEQEVRKQQIPITKFAEMICCQRNNVYDIFRRNKIDIILLKKISEVLKRNFFKELAEDLDLICEHEDTEKDKAVAQFFKSVPKVLRKLGKDVSIIWQELGDEYGDCPVPDFGLPGYAISFTIGDTMKDRIGNNPLLPFEYFMNSEGIELEISTNRLYNTKNINIKLDYKTDDEWLRTMEYAFEVYERLNIQLYVRK